MHEHDGHVLQLNDGLHANDEIHENDSLFQNDDGMYGHDEAKHENDA